MFNRKGMTLIEIILALALLGIIAVTFLSALSGHFVLLTDTRAITKDAFSAQKNVEDEIQSIKRQIKEGSDVSGGEEVVRSLFGRNVTGYLVEKEIKNNKKIQTIVGESRTPAYPVPSASNIRLDIYNNDTKLPVNYGYSVKSGVNLRAASSIDSNGVFLLNRHEWYISRKGFNIPIVSKDNIDRDLDLGRLYPLFPNDYIAVPILADSNMLNTSKLTEIHKQYAGRHVIYSITPYAVSGRKGETVLSEPVFFSGLPVINDSVLHLDASLISKEDDSSIVEYSDEIHVQKWIDNSVQNNNAIQANNNLRPILEEVQYREETFVWGKTLKQNDTDTSMNINSFTPNRMDNVTFFIVAKGNVKRPSENIIKGTNWSFGWQSDGILGFEVSGKHAKLGENDGMDGKWHVFTGIAGNGVLSARIDGLQRGYDTYTPRVNTNSLNINWKGMEIAELIIYNKRLSDNDLEEVETYLIEKYNPDPSLTEMRILSMKPIPTITVYKNKNIDLPILLPANMSNGTTQKVEVIWSNPIDTSTVGWKTSTAVAAMDNSKTVEYKVNVYEINYFKPLDPITIDHGYYKPLPSTLTAILTNGEEMDVEVTWSTRTDELDIGDHIITARARMDNTKTLGLQVTVNAVSVTGVTLNTNEIDLPVGSDTILYAAIDPPNATNKALIWSTDNPSIAAVDNNGRVTGISGGTAIVTVETQDGGFADSCQVNVFVSVSSIELIPSTVELGYNDEMQLQVVLTPEDAYYEKIEWESSNPSIVTVNENGLITGRIAGNASITVKLTTPQGILTQSCYVTVKPVTAERYEARNIKTDTSLFGLVGITSADIYIIFSDDTEHLHGTLEESVFLSFYPVIEETVRGDVLISGYYVHYEFDVVVDPN